MNKKSIVYVIFTLDESLTQYKTNSAVFSISLPSSVFWLVKLAKFSDFSNQKSKLEANLRDKHTIYFRQKIKGQTPISFFLEKVP